MKDSTTELNGFKSSPALSHEAEHFRMARRAANADCALLLTGATGTGKGHLARWIHDNSVRASGPFVPINCGAIPDNLIDSHLFGHARGAFSGAEKDHLGLIRAASGGTLLFDEISELPMSAQLRLLRLLEEREVQPVGYSKPLVVNVRIIAATNSDLPQAVARGTFRADLYFRLDVVRIDLRPLCERTDEIPHLLRLFNAEFARMYRQAELAFEPQAMHVLLSHRWPGNIRELRTVLERLHVLRGSPSDAAEGGGSPITVDDLRRYGQLGIGSRPGVVGTRNATLSGMAPADSARRPADLRLHDVKLGAVNEVLASCKGNVSRAAATLGVHRSTIYRWLADRHEAVPA